MYLSLPMVAILVALSGLFSGLTLGLLGLDVIGLQIVQRGDDPYLARCAAKIAPVRQKGNMLLCTLLLGNVAVNSALSILMGKLASSVVGFVASTALIVMFGEIIPQASCARYALQIGARTVPLVWCLMYSPLFFITKPVSMALDWVLGREMGTIHSRTELMEMLKLQISLGAVDEAEGEMAKQVAEGALSFRDKKVEEVMTPLEDAYMLSTEVRLGYDTIREIFETGYSRVPVYGQDKHDFRGLLYTKDLMLADPEDEMKIGDFIQIFQRKVETFFKNTKLVEVLSIFKKGGTHMGLVRIPNTKESTNPHFEVVGVLTLEDVVEEILQDEIVDETDVFVDVDNQVKVSDGRAFRELNLGIFNPVWRAKADRLSREEISAISKHLQSNLFNRANGMELQPRALEWLVSSSEVRNMQRETPVGKQEPDKKDILYNIGQAANFCTLILQGKVAAKVGREGFSSELGAFSMLARDALKDDHFAPDFHAFISTKSVRLLMIKNSGFRKALELSRDATACDSALCSLAEEAAGETSRKHGKDRGGLEDSTRLSPAPHGSWAVSPFVTPPRSRSPVTCAPTGCAPTGCTPLKFLGAG
uniref:CNNM transmembrane domain-containing protein n=1 Tax=Zooxanthella nutricula TaxID=1333877 RepID=A0A6U6UMF9_9DINO|mmetsp:Transcript_85271/g.260695  ORF Transcript_85271/g.260695 Transcript_85271/m.260695 type:complete len:591 (+) Transcript_85271:3-1775(+)